MQGWEYCQEVAAFGGQLDVCNAKGQDGWELVNMTIVPAIRTNNREQVGRPATIMTASQQPEMAFLLIFKRPLRHTCCRNRVAERGDDGTHTG